MPKETCRIALLADVPGALPHVAAWLYREWWSRNPANSLSTVVRRLEECQNRDRLDLALVALEKGIPVGTVSLVRSEAPESPARGPWLAALYVWTARRNRGIGTALVHAAERSAIRIGEKRLCLFTRDAMQFYRDLGWSACGRVKVGDCDAFVFEKTLHPPVPSAAS